MSKNYDLLMQVLKKWHVDKSKGTRCFGLRIRELARNGFPSGNIFEGNEDENYKKLKSLLRLADNKYSNEYSNSNIRGASGYKLEDIKVMLSEEYVSKNFVREDSAKILEDSDK